MKALCIGTFVLYTTVSIAAAASYSWYFYSTENVTGVDAMAEDASSSSSQADCVLKCAEVCCYRFRWNNGVCGTTGKRACGSAGRSMYFYNKLIRKTACLHSSLHFIITN